MTTKEVQKAGAIILSKNDSKKIALLYRGKQKDWSFPKGHTEDGENPIETMVREIKEETGLSVVILRELPDLQYTHPDGSSISTKMFLVNSTDDGTLKTEHESEKWGEMGEKWGQPPLFCLLCGIIFFSPIPLLSPHKNIGVCEMG